MVPVAAIGWLPEIDLRLSLVDQRERHRQSGRRTADVGGIDTHLRRQCIGVPVFERDAEVRRADAAHARTTRRRQALRRFQRS